jgi:hypothetical protein
VALFGGRSDESGDESDRESPWNSRGFVASVIVIAAIALCGLAWLLLGGGGSGTPSAEPTPTPSGVPTDEQPTTDPTEPPATVDPTPTESVPTTKPSQGGCGIPPGDQRIRSSAPVGVAWRFEGGILIPTKDIIGPGARDSSGVLRCFAYSPIGSVFAAMATLAQVQDETTIVKVIEQRVAPGPGRTRALAVARAEGVDATPGRANTPVQFVGFKIVDYTKSRVVLSLAVQTDREKAAGMSVVMRWIDGDWKMDLRSDGSISGDPDVLGSLDGYVRFRGA